MEKNSDCSPAVNTDFQVSAIMLIIEWKRIKHGIHYFVIKKLTVYEHALYIYIYISLETAAFMQGDINIAQMSFLESVVDLHLELLGQPEGY